VNGIRVHRSTNFATAAFETVGPWLESMELSPIKPSEDAFREATERWAARPRGKAKKKSVGKGKTVKKEAEYFAKRAARKLLWGGLANVSDQASYIEWPEAHLHPRKNSPTYQDE
jgi:hypothetical protein